MGSILGSIVSGFALGVIEGLTKVFYPEASSTVIFVIMALVLLVKPAGLLRAGAAEMARHAVAGGGRVAAPAVADRRGAGRRRSCSIRCS